MADRVNFISAVAAALLITMALPSTSARAQQAGPAATPKALPASSTPPQSLPVPSTGPRPTQPIDLPTALRLAGLNNLDLALVRDAQNAAKAANEAATLRFFPWLAVVAGDERHSGAYQDASNGNVLDIDRQLYSRAATLGIGVALGDAIFQKLAARQLQAAAASDVSAQRNDTLLAAADAYLDLVNSVAQEDIAREAVRISRDYEGQLNRAVAIGLTNKSEALRVGVQTQRDEVLLRQAQGTESVASAALATVLRLNPAIGLVPAERVVAPPTLIPLSTPLAMLVADAHRTRPELEASASVVQAAQEQLKGAKYGPLIPSISAQALHGQIRGGPNGFTGSYAASHDYVVGLSWKFGAGGVFDFSRTKAANAQLERRQHQDDKLRQTISQQVVDAYSQAQAARDQMLLARHGVELAQQSLNLGMQRSQFGVSAVLEVIQAQQDLTTARDDYANALVLYAKAQYALAHATGRIGP